MNRSKPPLPRSFYLHDTLTIAAKLLGTLLLHETAEGPAGGIIVETEAYLAEGDPASHAAKKKTVKNAAMFERGGIAYVYRIHQVVCLNAVTEKRGRGAAVLIRALQPTIGIELMRQRRGIQDEKELCSGPGKLCQALAIDQSLNFASLQESPLTIRRCHTPSTVFTSPRIGISSGKNLPFRFFIPSPFLSRQLPS